MALADAVQIPSFVASNAVDARTLTATQKFLDIFYEFNVTETRPNIAGLLSNQ